MKLNQPRHGYASACTGGPLRREACRVGRLNNSANRCQVLNNPEDTKAEEIETVIVDNRYSPRDPNCSVDSYLAIATNSDKFEPSISVEEIEVYTRKSDR